MINVGNGLRVPFVLRGLPINKQTKKVNRREHNENVFGNIAAVARCTFSSFSSCPLPKNQSCCWGEKIQRHWLKSGATFTATFTSNNISPHVQDKCLHYFVSVGHVGDHVGHVVLGRPHKSGTEHQGQVSRLHLGNKDKDCKQEKIFTNTLGFCAQGDLILLRVVCHFLQVANQELQCVEIVIWEVVKL